MDHLGGGTFDESVRWTDEQMRKAGSLAATASLKSRLYALYGASEDADADYAYEAAFNRLDEVRAIIDDPHGWACANGFEG